MMKNNLFIKHFKVPIIFLVICISISSCTKLYHPDYSDSSIRVPLDAIKNFYKGDDLVINKDNTFERITTSGTIISNYSQGNNILKNSFILQNGVTGITIILDDAISDDIVEGASVLVNVVNGVITSIDGNIAIKGISSSDIIVLNEAPVVPKDLTGGALLSDFTKYQSTLVQLLGGEILNYSEGMTYGSGDIQLDDGLGNIITLYTEPTASFYNNEIPQFGSFTGIPLLGKDGETPIFLIRSLEDVKESLSSIFPPGFPERFNSDLIKNSYARGSLALGSGTWIFDGCTIAPISQQRLFNNDNTKGVQMNQKNDVPLYLEMDFDVFKGASKVTVLYGPYGTDPGSQWKLEYSQNGGNSWSQIGDVIVVTNEEQVAKTAEFPMDIHGQVRFRIQKLPLGASDNGRLCIDDIFIYNND